MKTVKIYIEPASLPLTQHLLNYVKDYGDSSIINVIAFQRLKINTDAITKANTAFIDNVNAGLNEKLQKMAGFVKGLQPTGVEIHTNIHRERDILFPLMKMLAQFYPLTRIRLHLYDDGSGSLIERSVIDTLEPAEFDRVMLKRKNQLLSVLTVPGRKEYRWTILDNYIWHHLVDTRYYFITPHENVMNQVFYQKLAPYITYTRFTLQGQTSAKENALLLRLVNFPVDLYHRLTHLRHDAAALLFITSYCIEPQKAALYHQRLIALIHQLKVAGRLPAPEKIIFKGHPENRKRNDEIRQALGKSVTCVPDAIPVEFLHSFNLLPANIAGEFSSTFFSIESLKVKFVILKGKPEDEENKHFFDIARQYNAFDADKMIYL